MGANHPNWRHTYDADQSTRFLRKGVDPLADWTTLPYADSAAQVVTGDSTYDAFILTLTEPKLYGFTKVEIAYLTFKGSV